MIKADETRIQSVFAPNTDNTSALAFRFTMCCKQWQTPFISVNDNDSLFQKPVILLLFLNQTSFVLIKVNNQEGICILIG